MRRDVALLAAERYDVIVVGGGIHGACAAWEAALRGLKVALVEAGDFGHATSSNSLRTLHGGLRHLQRLDFARMRESVRERREWLRLAPHLARPMCFVLPTTGHGAKGPVVMRTALWINDIVSFDRNRDVRQDHHLPGGSLWSKAQAEAAFAGLALADCNGAAAWYDAVCLNTERLQLAVVAAAVAAGAQAANYVRAVRLYVEGPQVRGVQVRDELTDREFRLRAPVVINAAGPWVDEWLASTSRPHALPMFHASKAFNLLTRPLPFRDALGLAVRPRAINTDGAEVAPQTYFIIPWNGRSLVGTRHLRCAHATRSARVTREEVLEFLAALNQGLGEQRLTGSDVIGVFAGLLPEQAAKSTTEVALQKSPQVIDHAAEGISGLLSIVGVKWTTARAVAERAARIACKRLGRPDAQPLHDLWTAAAVPGDRSGKWQGLQLDCAASAHLEESYGPSRDAVLALMAADATLTMRVVPDLPVLMGQVVHAARAEMAVCLSDVVWRRTTLYLSEALDRPALSGCAAVLARELRWSRREIGAQIDAVEAEIAAFRGPLNGNIRPVAA